MSTDETENYYGPKKSKIETSQLSCNFRSSQKWEWSENKLYKNKRNTIQ